VKQKDKIITVHMKAYSALSGTYPLELFGTPHNLLAIEDIQITKANHPDLEQYNGMFLKEIAHKRNMGEFENFIDFVQKSNGIAAVLNHRYSNLDQVKAMIAHPAALFQTDATVHLEGVQNPAAFGNFPRILQYARDFNLTSLEDVVHKMTGASADRFGIKDRGTLIKNKAADVVVFDWQKVKDNNTDDRTSETPSGIDYVFINGVSALKKGNLNPEVGPGQII